MTQQEFKALTSSTIGKKVIYKEFISSGDYSKVTTGVVEGFGQICDERCLIVRNYGMRHIVFFENIITIK